MSAEIIPLLHEKIKLPLFHVYYDVCICPKMDVAIDHMRLFYKGINCNADPSALAYTMVINTPKTTGFAILINNTKYQDVDIHSTIVHECTHLSWYILDELGISMNVDNHEIQAYILEELVRKVTVSVEAAEELTEVKVPDKDPDEENPLDI